MKRIRTVFVILVIMTLAATSALFLNGCVTDGVGGLTIDWNGDVKVKINLTENKDNLLLTPPFEPDQADTTKIKELGTFSLDLLVNDEVIQYDKIEIFYFAQKIEVQKSDNTFAELDVGLLKFFKIELKSQDGTVLVPAYSTESYIGATNLTLNTKYTVSIMFNPSLEESEYTKAVSEEFAGAKLNVTICTFANIMS